MSDTMHAYDPEEPNEEPLSDKEEAEFEKAKNDKAEEELMALYDRVVSVKEAIENTEFREIFIQPIRGNIAQIKDDLESEEKTRDIALKQGALRAYKKMLNFPETAVGAFNEKLKSLKENMPLFMAENEFARNVSVSFNSKEYRIVIRGAEKNVA